VEETEYPIQSGGVMPISESTNQATAPSCFASPLKLDRKTFRPLRLTEISSFLTCSSVLHLTLGHTLAQRRGSVQAHLLISDRKVAGISAIFRVGALNAQRANAGSSLSRSFTGNRGSVQADLLTSESVLWMDNGLSTVQRFVRRVAPKALVLE
jgi:hypothetical protein